MENDHSPSSFGPKITAAKAMGSDMPGDFDATYGRHLRAGVVCIAITIAATRANAAFEGRSADPAPIGRAANAAEVRTAGEYELRTYRRCCLQHFSQRLRGPTLN